LGVIFVYYSGSISELELSELLLDFTLFTFAAMLFLGLLLLSEELVLLLGFSEDSLELSETFLDFLEDFNGRGDISGVSDEILDSSLELEEDFVELF